MDKYKPFETSIKWVKKETRDTYTYGLKILNKDIARRYTFRPGQFNMLYMPGVGEAPISISSSPDDSELTHTIRIAGDVTTKISRLKEGDVIGIRGPFGNGWPVEEIEDRELIIIAGGLGIAPLRSLIRYILKRSLKNQVSILYGAKTPKDIIFRDEFSRLKERIRVLLTVDRADPEEYWEGPTGLVTSLFKYLTFKPLNTIAFICGPEIMMQTTVRELIIQGVPPEKIFISMERNMNCGLGVCGHCMFGPKFVCRDGPVFRYSDIEDLMGIKEV